MSNELSDGWRSHVGAVVIGRNEGVRLERCLRSLHGRVEFVVYVDSGSTDGSQELARELGAEVVELDLSKPFTAARARNAGFAALTEKQSGLTMIQFIDGDCELAEGWIEIAARWLAEDPSLASVCGRRRERHPDSSTYNRLCDIEWDTPVGESSATGGDFMARRDAFAAVGGFNSGLIAGEEPELCYRLRHRGWKIRRLDAEMTLHDAAMTCFSQWWRRGVRGGWAYAEGAWLYGRTPERYRVRESFRIWLWAFILPPAIVTVALFSIPAALVLVAAFPANALRIAYHRARRGRRRAESLLHGVFAMLEKYPQLVGQLRFVWCVLRGKTSTIIEYK